MFTIHLAWAWLAAINATLPYSVCTAIAFAVIYAWRKYAPASWLWIESRLPWAAELDAVEVLAKNIALGLPSVILGAAVAAAATGGALLPAVLGAVAGAFAPVLHHVRKALPFDPYRGAVADVAADAPNVPKAPKVPTFPVLALALSAGLFAVGCRSAGAAHVPCDAGDHAAQLDLAAKAVECRARVKACDDLLDPYGIGGAAGAGWAGGSAGGEARAACRVQVIAECDAWGDARCVEGSK